MSGGITEKRTMRQVGVGTAAIFALLTCGVAASTAAETEEPTESPTPTVEPTEADEAPDGEEIDGDEEAGDEDDSEGESSEDSDAEELSDDDAADSEEEDDEDLSTLSEDDTESSDDDTDEESPEVEWDVAGTVVSGAGFPAESFASYTVEVEGEEDISYTGFPEEDGTTEFDVAEEWAFTGLGYGTYTLLITFEEETYEVPVTLENPYPALSTLEDVDGTDLVAALLGDHTEVSNISFTGDPTQAGIYSGWDAFDITGGIVLSTGEIYASGDDLDSSPWAQITTDPEGESTPLISEGLGGEGDADLEALIEEETGTNDAAVLEFDFVPTESHITFSYVFASEEYPEFVGSGYNDVFGFFVNGENHATFESENGETLPVSINTVNHIDNSHLFNLNDEGDFPTGIDGYTHVLEFTAPVNAGESNTLKVAIADVQDSIYDSLVFLQQGSFTQVQGPEAQGETVETDIDTAISGTFALDTNIDHPEWSIEVTSDPENGELDIDGTDWTYTPADGFTGTDSFEFTANDGELTSPAATVTIEVVEPSDEPSPTETADPTDEPTTTAEPSPSPTETADPTDEPTSTEDPSPTETADPSPTETADPTAGDSTPTDEPSVTDQGAEKGPEQDESGDDDLATTGAQVASLALGSVLLILTGAGALVWFNRRRQA